MATTIRFTDRFTDTELENATDFAARCAVNQPDNRGISQSREKHKRNLRVGRFGKIAFGKYLQNRCNFTAREIRNKLMKKGSFFFLLWILLSLLLVVYAEPPIEVIYWKASDVQTPSQEKLDVLNDLMLESQSFFASEMNRYGFGEKTFAFKNIEIIKGKHKLSHYIASHWRLINESSFIEKGFENQIYVIFLGEAELIYGYRGLAQVLCGNAPTELTYCNNVVVIPTINRHIEPITAHELGHAFGLDHVDNLWIEDRLDIMHHTQAVIPGEIMTLNYFALSQNDARTLNISDRLSVQTDPPDSEPKIIIDTDVNDDGYTDLYDCLIVRSGMSIESNYDTDINNDGVTNILDLMLVKAAAFEAIAAAAPSKRKIITTTWGKLKTRE